MAIIDKIRLSGTTYDLVDQSKAKVIEVTQQQYDAIVTPEANAIYVITDAPTIDISDFYNKSTINAMMALKQDALVSGTNIKTINNESILGSGNITIQGGSTYTAGRGISIANDEIALSLPISAGTGTNSIKCGEANNASGTDSFAIGSQGVKASGTASFAGGSYSEAKEAFSMAFGRYSITNNYGEVALGYFNKSNGSSSAVGNSSGNTLFSVGNGTTTAASARHNAFEIRQNGDIYCSDGTNDVKLQDTITATAANTAALSGKQDVLVSGTNIKTINNESILGSGNITIQGGGSITIDPTLDSGSTNAVANSAITAAIDAVNASLSGKQDTLQYYTEEDNTEDGFKQAKIETVIEDSENGVTKTAYVESYANDDTSYAGLYAETFIVNGEEKSADVYADGDGVLLSYHTQDDIEQTNYDAQLVVNADGLSLSADNGEDAVSLNVTAEGVTINDDAVVTESMLEDYATVASLSGKADVSAVTAVSDALSGKVNTSAVTSSVTSSSTDVVTSGGVYEQMSGLKIMKRTQAQYDAIVTKDPNVLYIIY